MHLGRDVLVLGFGDPVAPYAPQLQTLEALAPSGAHCVLVEAQWRTAAAAQLETFAALAQKHRLLICIGMGAGGYGALTFGRLLGAAAIYTAAPGLCATCLTDAMDLDDLTALFLDTDLATPSQDLRLVTADDSRAQDLAFLAHLKSAGVEIAVDHAALSSEALPIALAQSGLWAEQLTAGLAGDPVPDGSDIAALWRRAFAHDLEIDLAAAYQDADGAFHLRGHLFNRSPNVLDLALARAERIRIGARLRGRGDDRRVLAEYRSSFAVLALSSGQSSPFRFTLPSLPVGAYTLQIALVCDDRFWFDTVGFSSATFGLGAEPSRLMENVNSTAGKSSISRLTKNADLLVAAHPEIAAVLINALYEALLNRSADEGGKKHLLNALQQGEMTASDIGRALVASDEFRQRLFDQSPEMSSPRLPVRPDLPIPYGVTREAILDWLLGFQIDNSKVGELENYAREDCDRFLYTLDLIPDINGQLLEIGANPYFMSMLIKRYRQNLSSMQINYFGGPFAAASQTVHAQGFGETEEIHTFSYLNANIEDHDLPMDGGYFDVVLFCEVLEHMTNDPLRALREIKRLLRPNGVLILTTPNVARLENVARLVAGANLYDPYSGYGPYGRHNREYTRHELHRLMTYLGFEEEIFFTADVHENRATNYTALANLTAAIERRAPDLGQYLFSRWRNIGPAASLRPQWLYRSYPASELDSTPL